MNQSELSLCYNLIYFPAAAVQKHHYSGFTLGLNTKYCLLVILVKCKFSLEEKERKSLTYTIEDELVLGRIAGVETTTYEEVMQKQIGRVEDNLNIC